MLFNNKFILASTSKSRYKILKNIGLVFKRQKPNCNEDFYKKKWIKKNLSLKKISLELARLKYKSVSQNNKNKLVVGSDTVIGFNGKLLNKAKNIKEAQKTILKISGNYHTLYSSASVFFNQKEVWKTSQKSIIKIRSLSKEEIEKYTQKAGKKILSAIGCYHIELEGPNIVEEIKGDFFNIMGFTLFPFLLFLKNYKKQKTKETDD